MAHASRWHDLAEAASAAGTQMPLICSLCPKKPHFSDISHLLTHLASKAHLASKHKMELSDDMEDKRTLDTFNSWFGYWGMKEKLQDRAAQKQRKGLNDGSASRRSISRVPSNNVPQTRRNTGFTTTFEHHVPRTTDLAGRRARLAMEQELLDPDMDRHIKIEPHSGSGTPINPFARDITSVSSISNHPPHSFGTMQAYAEPSLYEPSVSRYEPSLSRYTTPSSGPRDFETDQLYEHDPSMPTSPQEPMEPFDGMVNDPSKLKGTILEGMGMFDSATPRARRQRNQKKDKATLIRLERVSEGIVGVEQVIDKEGILRRERAITGNPDDSDSHLEGESTPEPDTPPKKKQRGRKSRQPLATRDVNTARTTARRPAPRPLPRQPRHTRRVYRDDLVDEERDLTYRMTAAQPRRRERISVHRDNSVPDITYGTPPTSHPYGGMETLNSAMRTPNLPTNSLHYHGHQTFEYAQQAHAINYHSNGNSHERLPSFPLGNTTSFRPMGDASGMSSCNLSTFGHLNTNHGLLPPVNYSNNGFGMSNGNTNGYNFTSQLDGSSLMHPFGSFDVMQPMHGYGGTVHNSNSGMSRQNNWDNLNGTHHDFSMMGPAHATNGSELWADANSADPLFFGASTHETLPEEQHQGQEQEQEHDQGHGQHQHNEEDEEVDDNATISAPPTPRRDSGI